MLKSARRVVNPEWVEGKEKMEAHTGTGGNALFHTLSNSKYRPYTVGEHMEQGLAAAALNGAVGAALGGGAGYFLGGAEGATRGGLTVGGAHVGSSIIGALARALASKVALTNRPEEAQSVMAIGRSIDTINNLTLAGKITGALGGAGLGYYLSKLVNK